MNVLALPDFPESPKWSAIEKLREEGERQLAPMRQAQEILDRYTPEGLMKKLGLGASAFGEIEMIERAKKAMDFSSPIKQAQNLMERFTLSRVYNVLGINYEQLMRQAMGLDQLEQIKKTALASTSSFTDQAWVQLMRVDSGMKVTIDAADRLNSMGQYAHALLAETALLDPLRNLQDHVSAYLQPLGARSIQHLLDSLPEYADFTEVSQEEAKEEIGTALGNIAKAASEAQTQQALLSAMLDAIRRPSVPSWIQTVLFYLLLPILASAIANILSTLAIDYVKAGRSESIQEASKSVNSRAVAAVGDPALLTDYRFVSAKSLKVFTNAKALSPPIGEMRFGQAERVLRNEKDFSLVEWSAKDKSVSIQGWVFSRHLKKFG